MLQGLGDFFIVNVPVDHVELHWIPFIKMSQFIDIVLMTQPYLWPSMECSEPPLMVFPLTWPQWKCISTNS